MQTKSYKCPKHPNQQVAFFCTVNQWHFVPLCSECIPPHTQNHPKNFKISIQSFTKVREKSLTQNSAAIIQYKKRIQKLSQYLSSERLPQMFETLEKTKEKMIDIIEKHFEELKKQMNERIDDSLKFQKDLLEKLMINIKADIHDLENIDEINSIQQWGQIVKRLYFKDGVMPYLQEIDDIMKDHEERIFKRKDLCEIHIKKIEEDIKKILNSYVYIQKENKGGNISVEQKAKNQGNKDGKKQTKIAIKAKICKNCSGQLEYLTQLKKHLYCPNCGGKQRNYIKKQ